MGLQLNQILVGHSPKFCTTFAPAHLAGRTICRLRDLWLSWCPSLFFRGLQSTFSGQTLECWSEGSWPAPAWPLRIQWMYASCPWQWSPTVSFQKETFGPNISLGCLGISSTFSANRLKECSNPVPPLEVLPGYTRWPNQIHILHD